MRQVTSNVQGQGRNQFALPYRSNSDLPYSLPLAPRSIDVTHSYSEGTVDVRWDNPADYPQNRTEGFVVVGVHVYQTFDTPTGEYERLTAVPISTKYLRVTSKEETLIIDDCVPYMGPKESPIGEWVIYVPKRPLVAPGTNGLVTTDPKDVKLWVDRYGSGEFVEVAPFKVRGETGEVVINKNRIWDPELGKAVDAVVPDLANGGTIRLQATTFSAGITQSLNRKAYFKVTTVAYNPKSPGEVFETPLDEVDAKSVYDIERIDYTWAEGIRRNRWILDQGGEWVKLFSRKWNGLRCPHYDEDIGYCSFKAKHTHHCPICYGTNYIGGYAKPIDLLIAPPDSEKTVALLDAGLRVSYEFQSWTGPWPLLNDRDIIVRQNNDRFSVSRPNYVGSRGAIYQQSFSLYQLETTDAVYQLQIDPYLDTPEGWNAYREGKIRMSSPTMSEKRGIAPEARITSRTATFENIMF